VKSFVWNELGESGRRAALARPKQRQDAELQASVRSILEEVQNGGWKAACAIASRIDGEEPREVEIAPVATEARRSLSA